MNRMKTGDVSIEVAGSRLTGYLARPSMPGPGVLVLHAWWGLNDFFKQMCDRLAGEGFLVFAPDLNFGKIASTVAEAEGLDGSRDFEAMQTAAVNAVRLLKEQVAQQGETQFTNAGIALVGFSMGASWSMLLASNMPEGIRAVVLFYGMEGVELDPVRAAFQGHFAETDEYTKREWADELENDLRGRGLRTEFHHYPGTGHWFFESDRPEAYSQSDAELAWQRMVTFLRRELAG